MLKSFYIRMSYFICLIPLLATAQKKPAGFVLGTYPAVSPGSNYSITGFGNNYPATSTYNLHYGQQSSTIKGFNRVVKLFTANGITYSFTKGVPGAKPFRKVIINRSSSTVKNTALFESSGNITGSDVYLTPDYIGTMEDLINSYVINRGTDNVFINQGITSNNIERFDLLLNTPIVVTQGTNLTTSGFLLLERGGNDIFKTAAITGVNGDQVTALGTPVTINYSSPLNTDWGGTGQFITSVVMQQTVGTDANLKPSQNIASQEIAGVFISFADLGITNGNTVYGISTFAGDVDPATVNLLDISQYPKNTSETGNYGLDFMAGGGFFTKAILIKGTVWNDINGNAIQNPGEPGIANNLWANLVDPSGNVVSSIKVAPDGTYTLFIPDNGINTGNYSVILTNIEKYEGSKLSAADLPQNGFFYTGTNFNNTPNTANRTGTIVIGSISQTDISGVNFGIGKLATAGPLPITLSDFKANIINNRLIVQWTTLTETNNANFDIEISADGNHFTKIGTVASLAPNGNATSPLAYSFTADVPASTLAAGFGLLLLGGIAAGPGMKRRIKIPVLFALAICVFPATMLSCSKADTASTSNHTKLYIRITQHDINGQKNYSKVIVVNND